MEKITKEQLKKAAKNVMVDMSEEEYDNFVLTFDNFAKYLGIVGDFEINDSIEPMVFPYEIQGQPNDFKEYVSIDKDDTFKNSKSYKNGEVKIGKVIK